MNFTRTDLWVCECLKEDCVQWIEMWMRSIFIVYYWVKKPPQDFPGSPVVRTQHFHCRGPGFNPWSGNWDPASLAAWPKKKKRRNHPNCSGLKQVIVLSHRPLSWLGSAGQFLCSMWCQLRLESPGDSTGSEHPWWLAHAVVTWELSWGS